MIEPNIVTKNFITRDDISKVVLNLNKYSKFYQDKLNKLDISIEYDDTLVRNVKIESIYKTIHNTDDNTIKIEVIDDKLRQYKRIGVLTYENVSNHKTKIPFKGTCNNKVFSFYNNAGFYPPMVKDDTGGATEVDNLYLQIIVKKTTKDSVHFKLGSTKNIIPYKVQTFQIVLSKGEYEVFTKSYKYMDNEYKIGGLENSTEYNFVIKMTHDDEQFNFKCGKFRTKHGTIGKPSIKIQNVKENNFNIAITKFEGGSDDNMVEFFITKDGVLQKTITSDTVGATKVDKVSSNSKLPMIYNISDLEMNTQYTLNYRVVDGEGDEKMFYDMKKIKTKKPEIEFVVKRLDDGFVNISLMSVKNVSKQYNTILKLNNVDSKLKFDEVPLTKVVMVDESLSVIVGNVYLNDGSANYIVDTQRIFNIV